MKRFIYFLIIIFFVGPTTLQGVEIDRKCFMELERNFFKVDSVLLTFSYYQRHGSQGQWELAARRLKARNGSIPGLMNARAKKMRPNPLGRPFKSDEAVKLLKEIARQVFMDVMEITRPTVEKSWDEVFNYLFDYEIVKCSTQPAS